MNWRARYRCQTRLALKVRWAGLKLVLIKEARVQKTCSAYGTVKANITGANVSTHGSAACSATAMKLDAIGAKNTLKWELPRVAHPGIAMGTTARAFQAIAKNSHLLHLGRL
ncbi:hypothetical protein FVE85_1648 [Porphyridium purpureum]|uniref:Uncharacterized protein n=1 Tax=Porphyridium purpureum TaxID=35688 RepID=A0A5J4YXU7_PORPP|nr:hypothetical protein FVE85_1648 [Porphyridium purpureum]|eukprot:POR9657..scf209_3